MQDAGSFPKISLTRRKRLKAQGGKVSALFSPGDLINRRRYRIERYIDHGGMGDVYRAWDTKIDMPIALKFIRSHLLQDEDVARRFKTEVRACRKLNHTNVVRVHDLAEWHGKTYLTMDFLEGESLAAALNRLRDADQLMEWTRIAVVVNQVLLAVEHAHSRGVIHRDLKPGNIMLVPETDGKQRAVVMDFGFCRLKEETGYTLSGEAFGTLMYMAPEQIRGARDAKEAADIYSVGATAYEMLTGRPPFPDYDQSPVPSRARTDLPEGVDAWEKRAIAREPSRRYSSVREMLEALEAIGGKGGTTYRGAQPTHIARVGPEMAWSYLLPEGE